GHTARKLLTKKANLLGNTPALKLALTKGESIIRVIVFMLALTPIRYLFNWPYALGISRMYGLFALFYATLHFLVFLVFLLGLRWSELGQEIADRPYITLGFLAFVLMIPLGLTSFQAAQRRMGRKWKRLHRLIYATAVFAVMHII